MHTDITLLRPTQLLLREQQLHQILLLPGCTGKAEARKELDRIAREQQRRKNSPTIINLKTSHT